jgi:hypothetical protein
MLWLVAEKPLARTSNDGFGADVSAWVWQTIRGTDREMGKPFGHASPQSLVPQDHPLRAIRAVVNAGWDRLRSNFERTYAQEGGPSIAPERLLRALPLQALPAIRS